MGLSTCTSIGFMIDYSELYDDEVPKDFFIPDSWSDLTSPCGNIINPDTNDKYELTSDCNGYDYIVLYNMCLDDYRCDIDVKKLKEFSKFAKKYFNQSIQMFITQG